MQESWSLSSLKLEGWEGCSSKSKDAWTYEPCRQVKVDEGCFLHWFSLEQNLETRQEPWDKTREVFICGAKTDALFTKDLGLHSWTFKTRLKLRNQPPWCPRLPPLQPPHPPLQPPPPLTYHLHLHHHLHHLNNLLWVVHYPWVTYPWIGCFLSRNLQSWTPIQGLVKPYSRPNLGHNWALSKAKLSLNLALNRAIITE